MGKFIDKVLLACQQQNCGAILQHIREGKEKRKITLEKFEKIESTCHFEPVARTIQGVKALQQLNCLKMKESKLIECVFLIETAAYGQNGFIRNGKYAIQFDPSTSTSYLHFRKVIVGEGVLKKVIQTVRYNRVSPKLLVAAETDKPILEELHAFQETRNLPHIIQAKAILKRPVGNGGVKTTIIQKKYSPGALDKVAALTTQEMIKIARDLLIGLKNLHGVNLVHRDIKPKNILYNRATQEAVIADLGQARTIEQAKKLPANASQFYNPPEALRRERSKNDPIKSDLFSLGCVLYDMLFKKPLPWMKESILSADVLTHASYHDKARKKRFIRKLEETRRTLQAAFHNKPQTDKRRLKQVIFSMLAAKPAQRPEVDRLLHMLAAT